MKLRKLKRLRQDRSGHAYQYYMNRSQSGTRYHWMYPGWRFWKELQ